MWGTALAPFPSLVVRVAPGSDPTNTAITEIYEPPFPAYGVRGGDIDRNGVFWASFASGHLGSFDRRKCKGPLNGPQASGKHCPEGWTLYRFPGPQFRDVPGRRQRRGELLRLGGLVQHRSAWARTCRSRPAT